MKQSMVNALRKAIDIQLKIDSIEISLTPRVRVKKPGGGYDWDLQPSRPAQKFSIEANESILSGVTGSAGGITKGEGTEVHTWAYQLTGRYDAEIALNDLWVNGSTVYRVVGIQPDNEYSKVAVVSAIGGDPNYGN